MPYYKSKMLLLKLHQVILSFPCLCSTKKKTTFVLVLLLAEPLSHHSHDEWRCAQSNANSNRCKYFMDCISDHERAGAGACFAGECRIPPSEALQQGHHVYSASFWGFLSPP